jgi:hypothetical protein
MASFLDQYKRQAKIYVDLPSQGKWYPEGSLEDQKYDNLPVYAMTAMDEIVIKTPDALFNGESTVQIIKSCMPAILDPWLMPTIDLDYVLLAIRIATYGTTMPVQTTCPGCGETTESDINLTRLIDTYHGKNPEYQYTVGDLVVNLQPINYRQSTQIQLEEYNLQKRLINLQEQPDLSKQEIEKSTNDLITDLTKITLDLSISYINNISLKNSNSVENNSEKIYEFISQSDSVFYNSLKKAINTFRQNWELPSLDVKCANSDCSKEYKTNINLDYADFFGLKR